MSSATEKSRSEIVSLRLEQKVEANTKVLRRDGGVCGEAPCTSSAAGGNSEDKGIGPQRTEKGSGTQQVVRPRAVLSHTTLLVKCKIEEGDVGGQFERCGEQTADVIEVVFIHSHLPCRGPSQVRKTPFHRIRTDETCVL